MPSAFYFKTAILDETGNNYRNTPSQNREGMFLVKL